MEPTDIESFRIGQRSRLQSWSIVFAAGCAVLFVAFIVVQIGMWVQPRVTGMPAPWWDTSEALNGGWVLLDPTGRGVLYIDRAGNPKINPKLPEREQAQWRYLFGQAGACITSPIRKPSSYEYQFHFGPPEMMVYPSGINGG